MSRIDRYLLREVLGPFVFGLAAFTSLLTVNLLFSAIDYIRQGLAVGIVAKWVGLSMPEILVMTLPMACLLGSLLAFGRLSSSSETTAMMAGGLSLKRLVTPIALAGLLVSLGSLVVSDRLVPPAKRDAVQLVSGQNADALRNVVRDNFYYPVFSGGTIQSVWVASHFDGRKGTLTDVHMFELQTGGKQQVIYARTATWQGQVWVFHDGYLQLLGDVDTSQIYFSTHTVVNAPPPVEMSTPDDLGPDKMSMGELRAHVSLLRRRGADIHTIESMQVEYYLKLALPFAALVFTLIGVPFGLQSHRSSSSVGVGLSIVLTFFFYVLMTLTKSLGQAGALSPVVAAWLPDAVFGAAGAGLIWSKSR